MTVGRGLPRERHLSYGHRVRCGAERIVAHTDVRRMPAPAGPRRAATAGCNYADANRHRDRQTRELHYPSGVEQKAKRYSYTGGSEQIFMNLNREPALLVPALQRV